MRLVLLYGSDTLYLHYLAENRENVVDSAMECGGGYYGENGEEVMQMVVLEQVASQLAR